MRVRPFDEACAACHLGQIRGEGRAGAPGYPVLALPGFDVEILHARGFEVGEWPEFAEGPLPAAMKLLLSRDLAAANDLFALDGLDPLDLSAASDADLAAAARVVWAVKELVCALAVVGHEAFHDRLAAALEARPPERAVGHLTGALPADALAIMRREWLPRLADELARRRAGLPVAPPSWAVRELPPPPAAAAPDPGGGLPGGDDGGLPGDGGLLGGDDAGLLGDGGLLADDSGVPGAEPLAGADPAPMEIAAAMPDVDSEAWTGAGGWYRRDHTLFYRPIGHADPFLRAWIDLAANVGPAPGAGPALTVFGALTGRKAPGACGKCHSVDVTPDGAVAVNWTPKRRSPDVHRFTEYRHAPHFSLLDERGCATCHRLDADADPIASFSGLDPLSFAAGFRPMDKAVCESCHVPALAGDACTDCHNYHVGAFPPPLPAAPLRPGAAAAQSSPEGALSSRG